jgi:hypothetical protein
MAIGIGKQRARRRADTVPTLPALEADIEAKNAMSVTEAEPIYERAPTPPDLCDPVDDEE